MARTYIRIILCQSQREKRIKSCQKEQERLKKKYLPSPMYSIAQSDLRNEVITGIKTATESVYPEFQVLNTIENFFS